MSEFDNTPIPHYGPIDFANAEPLSAGGSSCDVFRAVHRQRKVFVKKLKDKYAYSDEYRAAFAKEYSIGVEVGSNNALPVYYDYHPEPPVYIVMDYIDGDTLADMVGNRQGQQWLRDIAHVRRMLAQIVDVVDYLHQANVVHCDIKADNVMITRGTRNVMLIDLGNCYTDWLCYASGNPRKYNLSDVDRGSILMDFRGIAGIVRFLEQKVYGFPAKKFRRFYDTCLSPDVTPDDLRQALEPRKHIVLPWVAVAVVVGIICALFVIRDNSNPIPTEIQPTTDTVVTGIIPRDSIIPPELVPERSVPEKSVQIITVPETVANKHDEKYYTRIIEAELPPFFYELEKDLDRLELLIQVESLSASELLTVIEDFSEEESAYQDLAFSHFYQRFPELDPFGEINGLIYNSNAWAKYMRRSSRISKAFYDEIRLRATKP